MGLDLRPRERRSSHDPVVAELLERVTTHCLELTRWERGFVINVVDQWDRTGYLTEPQIDTLRRIQAARC